MIRTRRGKRRREADTSGSSPILLPYTPSTLLIQVETYYLLLQLVNGVMDDDGMRNALRGSVGLFLYLPRSIPAINKHGNMPNRHQENKISLPAKFHRETPPCWVGRLPMAASGHRLHLGLCLVGPDVKWSVSGLGWLVWSGLWASFCMCDAALDILFNCVASFACFCLIPGVGACNPRITKTRGNG